jgi:hypothetical protein
MPTGNGLMIDMHRISKFTYVAIPFLALACAVGQAQTNGGQALDLGALTQPSPNVESRMVSPENPHGEKGKGGMAVPSPDIPFSAAASNLGQGWKVRPFIEVAPHTTVDIMDVDGPGSIEHIWMATAPDFRGNGRPTVLRFYWDGESTPSVEVPLTDFFAIGNDRFAPVNSAMVVDNPKASMNCYWPMPFRKHARVTVTNDSDVKLPLLTYQIDYQLAPVSPDALYFHAQWRRGVPKRGEVYTILDNVQGDGRYVGTFLAVAQLSDGWFGEGEVKFFIDGDKQFPTVIGTGTEDYFGGDYDFPAVFSNLYTGNTYDNTKREYEEGPPKWSLYRWHIPDPVNFHHDLKVTIQDLGWLPGGKYQQLSDDIASTAFWYQKEPHAPFPAFPPLLDRWPR